MSSNATPMFRQYHEIKARHRDAILMFRMGDFYEMFYEDAETASRALQITLTRRGKGTSSEAPMCGVPRQAVDGYIARLTGAGHKVAICEQLEDPGKARGLVRRDVVRVITPGTFTDTRHLESGEPNSLAAWLRSGGVIGLAWVDLSTGDFRLAGFEGEGAEARAVDLLLRFNCRELLLPEGEDAALARSLPGVVESRLEGWRFAVERARESLPRRFGTAHLTGFGVDDLPQALGAAGALLDYLEETQKTDLTHIDRLRRFQEADHLILDRTTLANLEVLRTQRDGSRQGSLLALMNATVTAMGERLLKERLLQPLRDVAVIRERLAIIEELVETGMTRARLRDALSRVADVERLLARLTLGSAGPRDVVSLGASLAAVPDLRRERERLSTPSLVVLLDQLDPLDEVRDLVARALVDDPPAALADGGAIRDGYDTALDEARAMARDGRGFIASLEARERERTGIASLKVRYNRVFGYSLEVSRANAGRVPPDYLRRQTLAGAERFVTVELREVEDKVRTAQERAAAREVEIFEAVRAEVLAHSGRLRGTAASVAALDVAAALAELAAHRGWCRPEVDDGDEIQIEEGRHPIVEQAMGRDRFVPNDTDLDGSEHQIQIITGPNMGGKSTLLRQVGLIVLMAQAGSFVPARRARIGCADRIFCRVGASDSLATGQSTFMVEMTETANILHHATPKSLVLLDEIGRGTATFDGLSIAWAVVEHLHARADVAARTLFATHYHELTELALVLPRVVNLRMLVREHEGRIVFLHRAEPGAADQSYGIQVAALAGVPPEVVERAREILATLEEEAVDPAGRPRLARRGSIPPQAQMPLFAARPAPPRLGGRAAALARERAASAGDDGSAAALEEIRGLRSETLTPLDALAILDRLHRRLKDDAR